MTVTTWYTCNGCGKSSSHQGIKNGYDEFFNVIKIDLTNYIAFSSGWVPSQNEIEIHFCNECYSKIQKSSLKVSTGESFQKIVRENLKIKEEKNDLQRKFDSYKAKISGIIQAGIKKG